MQQRFPFKFIVIIFCLVIIIVNQAGIRLAEAGSFVFPVPESKATGMGSIASDGTRLLVQYAYLDPKVDPWHPDYYYGQLKEWDGAQWKSAGMVSMYNGHLYIDTPYALAVQGNNIAQGRQNNDQYGVTFSTFFNGVSSKEITIPWWVSNPHDPTVAFACGFPYYSYIYGASFDTSHVHVDPLAGTHLPHFTGGSQVYQSALTGDTSAFYLAIMGGSLNSRSLQVIKADTTSTGWLGNPLGKKLLVGVNARDPKIVLWTGAHSPENAPVVAWKEGGDNIRVANWNPNLSGWYWLGAASYPAGTVGRLLLGASGKTLYLAFQLRQGSPATAIVVNKLDGPSNRWSVQDVPLGSSNPANVTFQSLAVYKGDPVVAFIENKVLKIVQLTGGGWSGGNINIAPLYAAAYGLKKASAIPESLPEGIGGGGQTM